jgi:hypothetical protein
VGDGLSGQDPNFHRATAGTSSFGRRCGRKSRQGRQRYGDRDLHLAPSMILRFGWVCGRKMPAGRLRYWAGIQGVLYSPGARLWLGSVAEVPDLACAIKIRSM